MSIFDPQIAASVPPEILAAAYEVERWFALRNIKSWKLDNQRRALGAANAYLAQPEAPAAEAPTRRPRELIVEIELARQEGWRAGAEYGWKQGRANALEEVETERAAKVAAPSPAPADTMQSAIDAAYERAAQLCEERSAKTQVFYMQSKKTALVAEYWFGASDEARQNAERIRALKGKP